MNFSLSLELETLKIQTRNFINSVAIPHGNNIPDNIEKFDELRRELQQKAREADIYLPQLGASYGGLGLNWRSCAIIFEEAGRSLLGPIALNCASHDESNMYFLHEIGTRQQKEQYLQPLANGDIHSAYAKTTIAPGASSDMSMPQTYAKKRDNMWVINGQEWFATAVGGASLFIIVAKTNNDENAPVWSEATIFLVDGDNPGIQIMDKIEAMNCLFPMGHYRVHLDDCQVTEDAVLGEAHKGLEHLTKLQNPTKLTRCMRWLGASQRTLEYAWWCISNSELCTEKLSEYQLNCFIADSEVKIHAARLMIWYAAWLLDNGELNHHVTRMADASTSQLMNEVMVKFERLSKGI